MKRHFTISDVEDRWNKLTGADEAETKHRVRLLREAGVLPTRRTHATDGSIARFIVGMLAGETHADAPRATIRVLDASCVKADEPGHLMGCFGSKSFREDLTTFIFYARRDGPWLMTDMSVCANPPEATVFVWRDGYAPSHFTYSAMEETGAPPRVGVFPVKTARTLDGQVIHGLAALASDLISDLPPDLRRILRSMKE